MRTWTPFIFCIAGAAGCVETGQTQVSVALFAMGEEVSAPALAAGEVPVVIDRAQLAFGPLYLCAGATAGDLCDTARLEWLDSSVIDLTDPTPRSLGELTGTTGSVRSWMYDLGMSSQLTRSAPYILDAAEELGEVSFVLEGQAEVDGIELPFSAAIAIQQTEDTELGVPVIRKSTSEDFGRDVGPDEAALLLQFDPRTWLRGVDFRAYVANESCAVDGPAIACHGTLERTCEGEEEQSVRDCEDTGQICQPEVGCVSKLVIEEDSEAYRALRNALLSEGRPSFEWGDIP